MATRTFMRWSGSAAALGGVLWVAAAVVIALKPEGCIEAECGVGGRSMREGGALEGALFVAAMFLVAPGVAAVVSQARRVGRFGRMGLVGLVASAAGMTFAIGAALVQALFFAGDFAYMPFVLLPAVLVLVVGLLLLAFAVLRAGVLPPWVAALLVIGALAILGANDQNARILLTVPLGIAWVAMGYALLSAQGERPAHV